MNVHDVIREPLVTEKSTKQEKVRKYSFRVHPDANKHQVQEAIERIFNVKVAKVNTMLIGGKWRRVRYQPGKTADWKKAIVTLKEGHKIELT